MNQHTYSFPKVTPVDARELREELRASRRQAAASGDRDERPREDARRPRDERER
jgi:hypothetical protein